MAATVTAGIDGRFGPVALLYAGHSTPAEWNHLAPSCLANYIGRIAPRPLLMLNSPNDSTFPQDSAVAPLIRLAGPGTDVIWTDGGHMVMTETEKTAVMTWLRQKMAD